MIPRAVASALLVTAALPAQPLAVYSEFRRVGPDGEVLEQDRPGRPREILSPAVPRNGFSSYRLVVTPPPGKAFALHVGENPESIVQVSLYRELCVRVGSRWLPDKLERISLPATGFVPMPGTSDAPETTAITYWMDIWVPAHAPPRRVRVEAQLNIGDDWIIYPMEVRIQSAVVPKLVLPTGALPPLTATSAESAFGPLEGYLCANNEKPNSNGVTIREMIRRNAAQDVAMARKLEPALGRETMEKALAALLDVPDAAAWCASRTAPAANSGKLDPEIYLKVRDYLIKSSVK